MDKNVGRPKRCSQSLYQFRQRRLVCYIPRDYSTCVSDAAGPVFQGLGTAGYAHNLGSRLRQNGGCMPPEARAGPSDEGHMALYAEEIGGRHA